LLFFLSSIAFILSTSCQGDLEDVLFFVEPHLITFLLQLEEVIHDAALRRSSSSGTIRPCRQSFKSGSLESSSLIKGSTEREV
jgi:hypothetical protein